MGRTPFALLLAATFATAVAGTHALSSAGDSVRVLDVRSSSGDPTPGETPSPGETPDPTPSVDASPSDDPTPGETPSTDGTFDDRDGDGGNRGPGGGGSGGGEDRRGSNSGPG